MDFFLKCRLISNIYNFSLILSEEKPPQLLAPIAMEILFCGSLSGAEATRKKDCNEERDGFSKEAKTVLLHIKKTSSIDELAFYYLKF